jgi:hypothetical protein
MRMRIRRIAAKRGLPLFGIGADSIAIPETLGVGVDR